MTSPAPRRIYHFGNEAEVVWTADGQSEVQNRRFPTSLECALDDLNNEFDSIEDPELDVPGIRAVRVFFRPQSSCNDRAVLDSRRRRPSSGCRTQQPSNSKVSLTTVRLHDFSALIAAKRPSHQLSMAVPKELLQAIASTVEELPQKFSDLDTRSVVTAPPALRPISAQLARRRLSLAGRKNAPASAKLKAKYAPQDKVNEKGVYSKSPCNTADSEIVSDALEKASVAKQLVPQMPSSSSSAKTGRRPQSAQMFARRPGSAIRSSRAGPDLHCDPLARASQRIASCMRGL